MLEENVNRILQQIKENSLVLDVGGWAKPFNRANYVVDIQEYKTRGFFGFQAGKKEYFSEDTWIVQDLSSKKLPFNDKQFDFVICSHTLEDIKDPIKLCSELVRVGKRGYIEVPSKKVELIKGVADKKYAGYYHHRWLIEVLDNKIIFRFKPHLIHNEWKYNLPKRFLKRLGEKDKVSYLFWEDSFDYQEIIQISRDKVEKELYDFVKNEKAYPRVYYFFDNVFTKFNKSNEKLRKIIKPKAYYHRYMDTPEYISKE